MKIIKIYTQEKIQYETLDEKNYIKKHLTLDGVLKKEKTLNINDNRVGNKFRASSKDVLEYLIWNKEFSIVEE